MKKKREKVKQDERRERTKLPLKSNSPGRSKDRNMPKNITHIPDENPVAGSQEIESSKTQMKRKMNEK